jgi:integrase
MDKGKTETTKRVTLTPKMIEGLKPAALGERIEIRDVVVPGLRVRVTDRGSKSFVLLARYGGSKNPTRRLLGEVGKMPLKVARTEARKWLEEIGQGIDPKAVRDAKLKAEEDAKLAVERKEKAKFGAVAEIFFDQYLRARGLRQGHAVARRIRNELVPHWGDLPIHSITRDDVEDVIRRIIKRGASRYAHNVLDDMKMLFGWAVDIVPRRDPHHLAASPCDRIKPTKLIGPKAIRTRVLNEAELRSLWKAGEIVGYPWGPLVQLLMLTGCRLGEVADASWGEFDIPGKLWTIPEERFKTGIAHRVPLNDDALALLDGLPRYRSGDFLFSTKFGRKPVRGWSAFKARIDEAMPPGIPPWCFHDIRRSLRSQLSALHIAENVAELVIGHGRKGIQKVYDQHTYDGEIRAALDAWANRLRIIVNPPPPNVVPLHKATVS